MPRLSFGVLADYAATVQGGKLVIAGEFDSITPQRVPVAVPSTFLVARIEHEGEDNNEHTLSLQLSGPSKKPVSAPSPTQTFRYKPSITPGVGRVQTIVQMLMLELPDAGRYEFTLLVDGEPIGIVPFLVKEPRSA